MSESPAIEVLIVGDGIAGCCAAVAAQSRGARVVMIDKAPPDVPHGNTAFSGSAFRRSSPNYPAEQFFADLMTLSDHRADPDLAHLVVDHANEAQDWLETLGVQWTAQSRRDGSVAQSKDRGRGLARCLRDAVRARPIDYRQRTEALALLRQGARVTGLRVRSPAGDEHELRAGAVILASGGFSANPTMVDRYIGKGARHLVLRGSPFNTGDGLRMAEAVGACLEGMDDFHGGLIHFGYKQHPEYGAAAGMRHIANYEVGILVNQDGRRFVDEGENTSDRTYAKFGKIVPLTQPGGFAYIIFDARGRGVVDPLYNGPDSEPVEAADIETLASRIGVPSAALGKTVADFNAGVRDGKCLSVTPPKTNFANRLDRAPFYAYKVTGGFTFTFGGLRTRHTGEVLDASRRVIPGLFAAGEITTGLFHGSYAGGSSLPKCTILGRMAGETAQSYAAANSAY